MIHTIAHTLYNIKLKHTTINLHLKNHHMDNSKIIRVMTIRFDGEIAQHEVPLWRGAVIARMQGAADVLFHNHTGDTTYRYSYPLIQYKRLGRKAAIVSIDEGADTIGQLFASMDSNVFQLGDRIVRLNVESVTPSRIVMQTWDDTFTYSVRRWLPLNSRNYRDWQQARDAGERLALLERVLRGNLLSMCKGLGIHIEDEVVATITSMAPPRTVRNKGTRLMAFDIEFESNLSIPDAVGLGKNASLGYGTVFACNRAEHPN